MKMASIFEAFFTVVYYSIRDTYTCAHVRIYRPLQNQDWFYLFGTGSPGFLTHTHTHTHLMALFPGLPGWAGTRKEKPIWILLKQETVSGSGISWAICTSLQTDNHASTLPLSFLQSGCPSCHPTNSVKALKGCMCFDNFDIYLICVTRPHCFTECKTLPIVIIVAWSVCLLVTRELCKNGWTDRGSIWLLTWVYLSFSSLCNGRGSLNCVLAHPGCPGQRAVKRVCKLWKTSAGMIEHILTVVH